MNMQHLQKQESCTPEIDGYARVYTNSGKPLYKIPSNYLLELINNKYN